MLTSRLCLFLSMATISCSIIGDPTNGQTRNGDVTPVPQIRFASISTGSDTTGDGSPSTPWKTISFALSRITDASELNRYEVRAASGTYQGDVNLKPWVSLLGGYEPDGWVRDTTANETVIKRQIVGVNMASHSLLDGFHMTGGTPLLGKGISCSKVVSATISNNLIDSLVTGIFCEKGSTVTLSGNRILNNRQEGIVFEDSTARVIENTIQGDQQVGVVCTDTTLLLSRNLIHSNGGGVAIGGATAVISANTIDGSMKGGGISASGAVLDVSGNVIVNNSLSGVRIQDCTFSIVSNTIRGNLSPDYGGGVSLESSSGILKGNLIDRNAATWFMGGGIFCSQSTVSIEGNSITNNTSGMEGGGMHLYDSSANLDGNLIHGNSSKRQGGGIKISGGQQTLIRNTCITANSTDTLGGGIYVDGIERGVQVTLINSTIAGNYNGGIYLLQNTPLCRIHNCIISGNSAQGIGMLYSQPPEIRYCVLQQSFPGEGNILSSNPMFRDTVQGDYRLRDGSPAIDHGSVGLATSIDKDGNPRPGEDGLVDIGAYESPSGFQPGGVPNTPARWYVKSDAPSHGDGKSWGTALRTIEAALNLRQASDSIWVASGTYTGHWILPPGVSLIGGFSGDESSMEERELRTYRATLQNASTGYSVVYLASKSLLDGFTITGGQDSGVRCDYATSATVTNNIITGNHTENSGGGLIVLHSTGLIANNVISGNSTEFRGGGISSQNSSPLFVGNTIVDNTATSSGGAVQFSTGKPIFKTCIMWGNSTPYFSSYSGSSIQILYSDIQGGYTGEGNIDTDPLFVNSTMGNYHLSANSPCIGKGTGPAIDPTVPFSDFEGDVREGSTCDIGADESTWPTILRDWIEY